MGEKTRFYADIMAQHPGVTGSFILGVINYPDKSRNMFFVDDGLFRSEKKGKDKNDDESHEKNEKLICNPKNLDFGIVTHNHADHVGRVPLLLKKGFDNNIYMTIATRKMAPIILQDTVDVGKQNEKSYGEKLLYSERDVERMLEKVVTCNYGVTVKANEHIRITFFENAHLPGAASVLIQISYPGYEDINLLFSGDYNCENVFLEKSSIPKWATSLPLTVVMESTYGDVCLTECIPKCFDENLVKALEQEKTVIIPSFAQHRYQEVLYRIKCMQEEKRISCDIPIYLDGNLAFKFTNLYKTGKLGLKKEMIDFIPANIHYVDSDTRKKLLCDYNSKVIVTTSGSGTHGPASIYIPEYIEREDAIIHFVGHIFEKSYADILNKAQKGEPVELKGVKKVKKADVMFTDEFSGHAKADQMLKFLNDFENLKVVLLNHGKRETKHKFADSVLRQTDAKYVGILGEGYLFRVNHYGFVKTMTTKFV